MPVAAYLKLRFNRLACASWPIVQNVYVCCGCVLHLFGEGGEGDLGRLRDDMGVIYGVEKDEKGVVEEEGVGDEEEEDTDLWDEHSAQKHTRSVNRIG